MTSTSRPAILRRQRWSEMDEGSRAALCARGRHAIFDPELRASIERLVDDVRQHGDDAVCRATARFDGIELSAERLKVSPEEIDEASVSVELDAAIDSAIDHLRRFNEHLRARLEGWRIEIAPGLWAGEKLTPISSAGLFVPGGKASYPSVAYQLGVPATVAGVSQLALVVPPVPGGSGEVDPAVLVVCRKLGIENVFRANGPAGIAALGFGTQTFPQVHKVVGPGSPAVTYAQVEMQRHGMVTMMLLGPTEAVVIADEQADPVRLAADLLIEAEHGTDSSVVLVTTSTQLADRVDGELTVQLAELPELRQRAARAALGPNGGCVVVNDLDQAAEVANRYAPEHLQLAVSSTAQPAMLDAIVNAGEILLGQDTPFSAANFLIGCPASLPTSGFAHVTSGITVDAFLKRTAIASADGRALERMAPAIMALADHEGFPAHGDALRRRFPGPAQRVSR